MQSERTRMRHEPVVDPAKLGHTSQGCIVGIRNRSDDFTMLRQLDGRTIREDGRECQSFSVPPVGRCIPRTREQGDGQSGGQRGPFERRLRTKYLPPHHVLTVHHTHHAAQERCDVSSTLCITQLAYVRLRSIRLVRIQGHACDELDTDGTVHIRTLGVIIVERCAPPAGHQPL